MTAIVMGIAQYQYPVRMGKAMHVANAEHHPKNTTNADNTFTGLELMIFSIHSFIVKSLSHYKNRKDGSESPRPPCA